MDRDAIRRAQIASGTAGDMPLVLAEVRCPWCGERVERFCQRILECSNRHH